MQEGKELTTTDDEDAVSIYDDPFFQIEMWKYDPALAEQICDRLREGKKLAFICGNNGFPPLKVVEGWRRAYPQFGKELISARRAQALHLFDDVLEMSREDVDKEEVAGRRLRFDISKFLLEKLDPGMYGEKKTGIEINAPTTIIVSTGISRDPLPTVEVIAPAQAVVEVASKVVEPEEDDLNESQSDDPNTPYTKEDFDG